MRAAVWVWQFANELSNNTAGGRGVVSVNGGRSTAFGGGVYGSIVVSSINCSFGWMPIRTNAR